MPLSAKTRNALIAAGHMANVDEGAVLKLTRGGVSWSDVRKAKDFLSAAKFDRKARGERAHVSQDEVENIAFFIKQMRGAIAEQGFFKTLELQLHRRRAR